MYKVNYVIFTKYNCQKTLYSSYSQFLFSVFFFKIALLIVFSIFQPYSSHKLFPQEVCL